MLLLVVLIPLCVHSLPSDNNELTWIKIKNEWEKKPELFKSRFIYIMLRFGFGFGFVTIATLIRIEYIWWMVIYTPTDLLCAVCRFENVKHINCRVLLGLIGHNCIKHARVHRSVDMFLLLYFLHQSMGISSELKINIKFPIKLEGIGCKNLYAAHVTEVWSTIPFYLSIAVSFPPANGRLVLLCVVHSKNYFRVRIFFVLRFLLKIGVVVVISKSFIK